MSLTSEERRHLAELFREDDRLRAQRAEHEPVGAALARKSDAEDVLYRDVLAHAPEPEGFSADQIDELAHLVNEVRAELRKEWEYDIERLEQRLLQTVVRLVLPGEVAEERVYALSDRVARMEQRIEKQISATIVESNQIPAIEMAEVRECLAALKTELRERKIREQTIVERSGRIAELQRENSATRAQLNAQQLDQAFAARDVRISLLETRLGMLLNFLGTSGDLPRGFGNDA